MQNILLTLRKFIPKEVDILIKRYTILRGIQYNEPIGRRSLSQKLSISEKTVRNETEYLKGEGYIIVSASGMIVSETGLNILEELKDIMYYFKGLSDLENEITNLLGCDKVIVVPGDVDKNEEVKAGIGEAGAEVLMSQIQDHSIIAITGGSTSFNVINAVKDNSYKYSNVSVVPARGGLRNNFEYQANTLVSLLASKIGADYHFLNIPDNISQKALESVREEPDIKNAMTLLLRANIILYGIGNALVMAQKRNMSDSVINDLKNKGAVAEALGYYFNKSGEIVYTSRSISIKLEHMTNLAYPIAVAGGAKKAEAIIAVRNLLKSGCLVIDEGAANNIIAIMKEQNVN